MHSVREIQERLAAFPARRLAESETLSHAAVALVLRAGREDGGAELLMIRRAERPGDPWSGHMGFPGGRVEPGDPNPQRAAVRETFEELGLRLDADARYLGALSEIRARSGMTILPLSILPFVFELVTPSPFHLNHEVAESHWIPLQFFVSPEHRTTMPPPPDTGTRRFPCYRFAGRTIWGLSLMMLDEFLFEVLPPGEISTGPDTLATGC